MAATQTFVEVPNALRQGLRGVGRVLLNGHGVVGGEEREQSNARGEDVGRRALRRHEPHLRAPSMVSRESEAPIARAQAPALKCETTTRRHGRNKKKQMDACFDVMQKRILLMNIEYELGNTDGTTSYNILLAFEDVSNFEVIASHFSATSCG